MVLALSTIWTNFHPPKPEFNEESVPNLNGKVYIVSGSNTGIGKELTRVLYTHNAKVYVAARSEQKAKAAISEIQATAPASTGSLVFLHLDLSDLNIVKAAAKSFTARESRLHVLFNNAGVMGSPTEPPLRTKQGYEETLGVNCVGTHLFTQLLTPTLIASAASEPKNTVRVVWFSSFGLDLFAAKDVGVQMENIDYRVPKPSAERYGISKTGVWALGTEYARRHRDDGVLSVPINPGNLNTELPRDQPFGIKMAAKLLGYRPVLGAYTALFAGLSPQLTMEDTGTWIIPFGRKYPLRPDLNNAIKTEAEGGTGGTLKFWQWSEDQIRPYL